MKRSRPPLEGGHANRPSDLRAPTRSRYRPTVVPIAMKPLSSVTEFVSSSWLASLAHRTDKSSEPTCGWESVDEGDISSFYRSVAAARRFLG